MRKFVLSLLILAFVMSGCTIKIKAPNLNDNDTGEHIPDDTLTPEAPVNPDDSEPTIVPENPEPTVTPENPKTEIDETKLVGSDNDLLRINIFTNDNSTPTNQGVYHQGSVTLTEQNPEKIIKDSMGMKIKVRGNSTSAPDKKPYKIKFDQAQSFFGLEAAKDWILLANYFDKTNIRNYLAYKLANKLDNLDFQPSYIFVDVYLNNSYQGMYMLTEQIEANNGRVDIKNHLNSNGISSFLLEADARAVDEYAGYEDKCYFNVGNYYMTMKYPSADDYIEALESNDTTYINEYEKNVLWVRNFMVNVNNSIKSNDYNRIEQYIDVDSFIDYYIVQEFFKNVDVGSTSQYYVIDQNDSQVRLKCGPVWDFDISSGVVDNSASDIYTNYTYAELYVKSVDYFYSQLLTNQTFLQKLKSRYKEVRSLLVETIAEIEIIKNDLAKAQNRNLHKWELPTQRRYWIEIYAISKTYYNIRTLNGHYNHLTKCLNERLTILDKYYS